jgi:hypothetical protein
VPDDPALRIDPIDRQRSDPRFRIPGSTLSLTDSGPTHPVSSVAALASPTAGLSAQVFAGPSRFRRTGMTPLMITPAVFRLDAQLDEAELAAVAFLEAGA